MLNLQPQTQLVSLWKAVENLDDSHAAGMVRLFPALVELRGDTSSFSLGTKQPLSFRAQHVVIPTLSEAKGRNLLLAYTATDAVWYSS
jgi:hypothetical protein